MKKKVVRMVVVVVVQVQPVVVQVVTEKVQKVTMVTKTSDPVSNPTYQAYTQRCLRTPQSAHCLTIIRRGALSVKAGVVTGMSVRSVKGKEKLQLTPPCTVILSQMFKNLMANRSDYLAFDQVTQHFPKSSPLHVMITQLFQTFLLKT